MNEDLMAKIMDQVMKKMGDTPVEEPATVEAQVEEGPGFNVTGCGLTEFVGTAIGDTIGLVIANVDYNLHELMNIDKKFRSIGIVGGRTGAGPHIFAADEAVKATNSEIVLIELPRDTKGGAGHGSLVIFGAEDVSDARRAVEVTLKELNRTFGDVYGTDAGHLEFQYCKSELCIKQSFWCTNRKVFWYNCWSSSCNRCFISRYSC